MSEQNTLAFAGRTVGSVVEITRQFLRSVRIDTDLGRADALDGYLCQGTARSVLDSMARQLLETQQRAFTWTGPYGGGKSSLALALCSLVGRDPALRAKARRVLGIGPDDAIARAFAADGEGWLVVPVVGTRDGVVPALAAAIAKARTGPARRGRRRHPIEELKDAASERQGVLLVIDELGKFLEGAAQTGDDVYFYQQLAEEASRCDGKLVVVGILHQAFEAYATRMGRDIQDEWAKVQGRFVDIPLVAATDEVIELTARAITLTDTLDLSPVRVQAEALARDIRRRRPSAPANLGDALARCWPLHPATAALLGPMSRRRYGQNERSTFGFLASREPLGFVEFINAAPLEGLPTYTPAALWDYLRANLEPAILASTDAHRWSSGVDAVQRAEAKGSGLHAALVKTIALVEMFRTTSGLAADDDLLCACLPGVPREATAQALLELSQWSIVLHRKHLDAWGLYAGSDFDIEAATERALADLGEPDLARLSSLTDLVPLIAKRLYHETGTLRWFNRLILRSSELEAAVSAPATPAGAAGTLALVLPVRGQSSAALASAVRDASARVPADALMLLGVAHDAERIVELATELSALERIFATRPELEGDLVARREVDARIAAARTALADVLRTAFDLAQWYTHGHRADVNAGQGLSVLVSRVAAARYDAAPLFFSELLNRDTPSSNAVKARRDLMYRMLTAGEQDDLGYGRKYPADAGLYYTVLKPTRLHREIEPGRFGFAAPDLQERGASLQRLWAATRALVEQPERLTTVDQLYALWAAPPFGVKAGVLPVLALAYFLAHRDTLALHVDGTFSPELSEVQVDEWLQDARRIAFRHVQVQAERGETLVALATLLGRALKRAVMPAALEVARALVALVLQLPRWAQRTTTVSKTAQELRAMLLRASDPHRVLFIDLPVLLDSPDGTRLVDEVRRAVDELTQAYPRMLGRVAETLRAALDDTGLMGSLRARADNIVGLSGDFTFESFITRLRAYGGSPEDIEGLITLAVSRPSRDWTDRDIEQATLTLSKWAREFRRVETLAALKGRKSNRMALAILSSTASGEVMTTEFDVGSEDLPQVDALANRLLADTRDIKREVLLAALVQASRRLAEPTENEV